MRLAISTNPHPPPPPSVSITGSGNGSQQNLRLGELGLFAGVDDVAHHGDLASPSEGKSIDGGDDGLRHRRQAIPVTQEVAAENAREFVRLHLFDIGSGGESSTAAWRRRDEKGKNVGRGLGGTGLEERRGLIGNRLGRRLEEEVRSTGFPYRHNRHVPRASRL